MSKINRNYKNICRKPVGSKSNEKRKHFIKNSWINRVDEEVDEEVENVVVEVLKGRVEEV